MNSTDYSNAIFAAIDVIVDKKLSELNHDKTIKCTVIEPANVPTTRYRVERQGQRFEVETGDREYKKGDIIYVLIPENDMRNKKFAIAPGGGQGSGSGGSDLDLTFTTNSEIDALFV